MFDDPNFILFTFVLMRMSGFVLLNPILGRSSIPSMVKAGFILALTVIVYSVSINEVIVVGSIFEYMVLLFKEFVAGYVLGFVVSLFSYVISFAGEFVDMQMGMSMAKIYDAQSNASLSMSATYFNVLYMLVFFTINGHLALIDILITSYKVVPYGNFAIGREVVDAILALFIACTNLAVKMAFPIIAIEFLGAMGMGMLMKTIPQINVFVVDIQLKIFVGISMLLIMFSPISEFIRNLILNMIETLRQILTLM